MPIICFFGPDGSGKTTLVKILVKRLSCDGLKTKVSWMRGSHTAVSLLAKCLSNFSSFKGTDNPYYGLTIPQKLRRLWQLFEFASAIPIILVKFTLPSLSDCKVVAERYAPDFVIWVSITTNDKHYLEKLEARFLTSLSSKACTKIYLTANLEELKKRRKENADSLSKQLELYEKIASSLHAYKLDTTNRSANESLELILNLESMQKIENSHYCKGS